MEIYFSTSKENVNWHEVAEILNDAGLSELDGKGQELVFKNSYVIVLAYDGEKIVGCGRAISDGVCQAAIYNIAFRPEYRGIGLGSQLVEYLLELLNGQSIILYTNPPGVSFYERFGFSRAKTAMCIYDGSKEKLDMMREHGFLLPKGYRFTDENVGAHERIPEYE